MPDGAQFAVFIHLLGVCGIAGSSTGFLLVMSMMRRAKTVQELRAWSHLGAISEQAYPFATLVLLLSGGYMVQEGGPDVGQQVSFGDGWIMVSAIALVLMAVASLKINTLKMNAIHHAAEGVEGEAIPPALAQQINDPVLFAVTHAMSTGQLGIIWNMTTRPGDAEAGIVVVLAVLVGVLSAAPIYARQQRMIEGAG